MNILHITMAMILVTTGSIPQGNTIVTPTPLELESNISQVSVIRGVSSTETIITPKPVEKTPVVVTTNIPTTPKANFFASTDSELASIPAGQASCYDYVPVYAAKYGVDPELLTRIIRAESGGNPMAKNTRSTASGCGQFIRSTWAGTLRQMGREWVTPFNAEANVDAMAWKIANGGIGAWNASRSKWAQ